MKQLATGIASAILAGTGVVATINNETVQLKEEKSIILQDNIWKSVRIGEIPVWDISVVSQEEMTKAYADLANQKNAKEKANLFDGLRD
ncbi:MAG: hypothetical protein AAB922_05765, partial [Patescibacteria group bacterium]